MSAELVADIQRFIRRFVVMTDDQLLVVAVWVLHTYTLDAAVQTSYLAVTSPERRCGKTRLLEVLELLVHKPWMVTLPSEAVLFRYVDAERPTLLLDELDAVFNPKTSGRYEGHRALLNGGNRKGLRVPRCVGDGHDVQNFDVFCAKVLAGIGVLPDTVADRSIPMRLQRRTRDETVERLRRKEVEPEAADLRDRCRGWVLQHLPTLADARPTMPDELDDRAQDGCEIIIAIAELLGVRQPVCSALVALYGEERVDQVEWAKQTLLRDCRTVFDGYATIPTNYLLAWLHGIEGSPWKGWYGRGLDANDLAKILRDYGVHPTKIRYRDDTGTSQVYAGYKRDDFEAAWARYLSDDT